jgi:hypothetical protein
VDVVGDHAYICVNSFSPFNPRLVVINVSDPEHPTLQGTASSLEIVSHCVSVAGDYAYVGGRPLPLGSYGASVRVINISNPGQPLAVGGFDLPGSEFDFGVNPIAAEGSLLHCGLVKGAPGTAYGVFDLTDPRNPLMIGLCGIEYPPESIQVRGNQVFCMGGGLNIIDITNPQAPQLRSWVEAQGPCYGLDVANDEAYLSDWGELRILNVRDPANPVQVGQFDTRFQSPFLSIEGDLACLLDGPRLRILNLSNSRTPILVGAKDLFPLVPSGGGIKVAGQRAYLVGWDGQIQQNFLQILDLSDSSHPIEVGRNPVDDGQRSLTGLDIVGSRAYVSGYCPDPWAGWLTVIDVSNPATPVELGTLSLPDMASRPQVIGDFAYVQLYESDLVIVDIRDPGQMAEIGRYHPTSGVGAFQVAGRYAYVYGGGEVHVVDLADPANPTRLGRYLYEPGTIFFRGLQVSGRHAFVIYSPRWTDDVRVDILDVGDPTQPVKAGEYDPEQRIANLAMVGNTLYATSEAGLTVLDFFAPNTSPRLRLNTPVLSGDVAVLTWDGGPGIKLQKTTSLTSPDWQDVPNTEGKSLIALPPTDTVAFFRLTMPLTQP